MTDISKEAVEAFIQGPLKEAVLSEGMPRNADDTKDAYATVALLRALSARIEQLEAALEYAKVEMTDAYKMIDGHFSASQIELDQSIADAHAGLHVAIHTAAITLALIDKEPTT